jgi:hypothetical protein
MHQNERAISIHPHARRVFISHHQQKKYCDFPVEFAVFLTMACRLLGISSRNGQPFQRSTVGSTGKAAVCLAHLPVLATAVFFCVSQLCTELHSQRKQR